MDIAKIVKWFVLYLAFMILSLIVWLISLPLVVFLRDIPPHPIINFVRTIFWEVMKWIFPISLAIAIILYFVYKILRPILLGFSLGIFDLRGETPFKELWDTGVFDWIEALLTLNPVAMYHATKKLMLNTPKYARELLGNEINEAEKAQSTLEANATNASKNNDGKANVDSGADAQSSIVKKCIDIDTIPLNNNMTKSEREQASSENDAVRKRCEALTSSSISTSTPKFNLNEDF